MEIDIRKYQEFVLAVTSQPSKNTDAFMNRIDELALDTSINVPLLITGAIGLGSETGELEEIVKKVLFQGKPLTDDVKFHIKRELGDVIWYWINTCTALGLDPNSVVSENIDKLKARYPGGEFDAFYSENRKKGDL